tara:strand:+ start:462 stop:707 length:246 start_codon:yes stop_codon:yes gene_type:complete
MNFKNLTRRFLLGEWKQPSPASHLQALKEILESLKPKTVTEKLRLEVAFEHLREVRKNQRRLEEKLRILEEQANLLEEKEG